MNHELRSQFPILHQRINGYPLAYLDTSATTQKPQSVIDAITRFYSRDNANIHRGIHDLSERASAQYDHAREIIATFIGAGQPSELIFTRGTTESINLVAQSFLAPILSPGDAIVTTIMEHHSNFVPWQQLCQSVGADLRVVPITSDGMLDMAALETLLDEQVRLLSLTHISNVLGVINPIPEIIKIAHERGIPVLVDGAQSIAHLPVDVVALDVDFFAFSGHKLYGPTGIGGLYVKQKLLQSMRPYQYGGDMIATVSIDGTTWNDPPYKFEAGTPHIAGAIGLGAAVEFVSNIGMEQVRSHEIELLTYAKDQLQTLPEIQLLGPDRIEDRSGLYAFSFPSIHPHDLSSLLNDQGVAVRAGFHCAEPLHRSLGLTGSTRASFGVYSTKADVDQLIAALKSAIAIMGV